MYKTSLQFQTANKLKGKDSSSFKIHKILTHFFLSIIKNPLCFQANVVHFEAVSLDRNLPRVSLWGINVNVSEQEKDVKQLSEIVSPYVEFMTYLRQCLSLQRLIWR